MMRYLYRLVLVVGSIFFIAGCFNSEEPQNLAFVTTPEADGQPAFIPATPSSGYPGTAAESGYPVPSGINAAGDNNGYPAPVSPYSKDGRSRTAIQSYSLAAPVALDEFHPDAYLAAIAPSHIMLTNLGNPPVLPGWFFKFRKPESRREFIVHVVDDIITGTTLTEAAMDVGPVERPLDLSQVKFDSADALAQFQQIGSERGIWSEAIAYDLELVYLEGTDGPVWSVVDPFTREWVYSINAVTGEETRNPYQQ